MPTKILINLSGSLESIHLTEFSGRWEREQEGRSRTLCFSSCHPLAGGDPLGVGRGRDSFLEAEALVLRTGSSWAVPEDSWLHPGRRSISLSRGMLSLLGGETGLAFANRSEWVLVLRRCVSPSGRQSFSRSSCCWNPSREEQRVPGEAAFPSCSPRGWLQGAVSPLHTHHSIPRSAPIFPGLSQPPQDTAGPVPSGTPASAPLARNGFRQGGRQAPEEQGLHRTGRDSGKSQSSSQALTPFPPKLKLLGY